MRIKIFSVTLASLLMLQAGCADQSTVAGPPPNASAGPPNVQAATGDQPADQKTSPAPSQGFPRAAASNDSNSGSSFFSVGTMSSIGAAAIAVAAALAAAL